MKQGEFSRTKVAELMGDYFLLLGLVLELPCIFLKRKKKGSIYVGRKVKFIMFLF